MRDATPLDLEVSQLTKTYGGGVTIGPISLQVRSGEFFSLLGPSGCGKTTTLRCVAGFEDMSGGKILLGGEQIDTKPPHHRNIGLVFQDYALFPHLTVFDNVAFGLRLRKRPRPEISERVQRVLAAVSLSGVEGRYPGQLSGGQQQRVAIARALILEPGLLLLDEPLSNLDLKLRVQMRYELRRLQKQLGMTSVYVTHDQTEALALSDRIAVLHDGKVVQVGTPAEIYGAPATAFVAEFVGSSNMLSGTVTAVNGESCIVQAHGMSFTVHIADAAVGTRVTLMVRPERVGIAPAELGEASGTNHIVADVDAVTFLGEDLSIRANVHNCDGLQLVAAMKNVRSSPLLRSGDKLSLRIEPSDFHVLRQ